MTVSDEELDVFLAHYGVPGMKWGVRRSPAELAKREAVKKDRSDQKAVKKAFRQEAFRRDGSTMERRVQFMFDKQGLGTIPYSELSTKSTTIAAGKTFYRVSGAAQEPIKDINKDIKFVSTSKKDHNKYVAVLPRYTIKSGFKDIKPTYEHTYKTTTKLTLPSEKDRIDAFAEVMDTKSVKIGYRTMTGRQVLKRAGYRKEVRQLDSTALGQKFFNNMQTTAWQNQSLADAYFKTLRSKGFNAVADDNDRNILTKDPVILLNPNGSIKSMKVKQITEKDVRKAMSKFSSDI